MISKEELYKLGYSDNLISNYVDKKKMKLCDDGIKILNDTLLFNIFYAALKKDLDIAFNILNSLEDNIGKCYFYFAYYCFNKDFKLANKYLKVLLNDQSYKSIALIYNSILNNEDINIEDIAFEEDNNIYQTKLLEILKKYISLKKYKIAEIILKRIKENNQLLEYDILEKLFSEKKDTCNYIIEDIKYDSSSLKENAHLLERELLVFLEYDDYDSAMSNILKMINTYTNQDLLILEIISLMIRYVRLMQSDKRFIHTRNCNTIHGDYYSVLYELLRTNDLYRVRELIKNNKSDDIVWLVLDKLSKKIIVLNEINNKFLIDELYSKKALIEKDFSLLNGYSFPSINKDFILTFSSDNKNDYLDDKVNYFAVYQDEYKSGNYQSALDALNKFLNKMEVFGIKVNMLYLVKELEILIENKSKYTNYLLIESNLKKAISFMDEKKYYDAIKYLDDYLMSIENNNPRALALKAKCLKEIGNIKEASKYYLEADKVFLYPNDYLDLIDCLYEMNEYEGVLLYSLAYEDYYPDENIKLYYLLSIVNLKLGDFSGAREMLQKCVDIGEFLYNINISYDYELGIINKLEKGESVVMYTMKDFVDYNLTKEEENIKNNIYELKNHVEGTIAEIIIEDIGKQQILISKKIEYLLSIIKIFIYDSYLEEAKKIVAYVDNLLKKSNIEEKELYRFTKTLKNYKNL